jgi:hypothetical protein
VEHVEEHSEEKESVQVDVMSICTMLDARIDYKSTSGRVTTLRGAVI